MTDSSAVKAHRSAAGGKRGEQNQAVGRSRGGLTTKIHALTERSAGLPPSCSRAVRSPIAAPRRGFSKRCPTAMSSMPTRPTTPTRCVAKSATAALGQHSTQGQPHLEKRLLAVPLPQPQRDRTHVLPPQGLSARRYPLRPKRDQPPRRRLRRRAISRGSPLAQCAHRRGGHTVRERERAVPEQTCRLCLIRCRGEFDRGGGMNAILGGGASSATASLAWPFQLFCANLAVVGVAGNAAIVASASRSQSTGKAIPFQLEITRNV